MISLYTLSRVTINTKFVLFFRNGLSSTLTGKVNQLEVILKQLQHDLRKVSNFTVLVLKYQQGSLVDLFYLTPLCLDCL